MGKKTSQEKDELRTKLDLLMNLTPDVIQRNPKIKALYKDHELPKESIVEYNKIIKETYGVFPYSGFPVWDIGSDISSENKKPSELFLKVDLNYTKDEIMFVLEKFVTSRIEDYKGNLFHRVQRRNPEKWVRYLEVWDLKNGDPPWQIVGNTKMPFGEKRENSRPWTYEEIAKYIYPGMDDPEQLEKAIDKVKKDYRAAYKLICGEVYSHKEFTQRLNNYKSENYERKTCGKCPNYENCKELCPDILEELARDEIKQQHCVVGSPQQYDLDVFAVSNKRPSME